MTLIDYAKYLLNVCGRRFTHLYRRHYLESTNALPSLSALLSYLKTQTASIYTHLLSRGCTQSTPTFANLLPTIHQLDTRKIDAGASTQIPDGMSLVRLLCDTTAASAVTELIDTNTGWTSRNEINWLFSKFTNLTKIHLKCKYVYNYLFNRTDNNIQELKCDELEYTDGVFLLGGYDSSNSFPSLSVLNLPNLKEVKSCLLFDGSPYSYTTTGFMSLTELHLPMLQTVTKGDFGGEYRGYFIRSAGTIRLYLDSLEILQYNYGNYQAAFIMPNLEYMYIGYTENSRSNSIIIGGGNNKLSSLTDIELKDGFKRPLNVSGVTTLTRENIVNHIINKLAINDGAVITITLGSTNLAKLTAEDIAIANAKGYTLA